MANGTGATVEYFDYNNIQQLVVGILGQYPTGYGQSPQTIAVNGGTGQVAFGPSNDPKNVIRYPQWNALLTDITSLNYHLLGTAPVYNGSLLTNASSTTLIKDSDRAAYLAVATALTSTSPSTVGGVSYPGCYALANSGQASLLALSRATRSTAWNNTVTNTVSLIFANYQTAQYYFQSGSQFQLSASLTGGTSASAGTKDYDWAQLLNVMGIIKFGLNSTTVTGSGTAASSIGFNQLTSNAQTIFTKTASTYSGNQYVIQASLSGATITFSIQFQDNSGQPNPPWGTDENVTGTITSTVNAYYASGSYVSVSGYVPSGSNITSSGP
jgi:hypothetical protein